MKHLNYLGIMPALLTVLFIHHKMIGTVEWSWLWIVSPLWIPLAGMFLWTAMIGFIAGFKRSMNAHKDGRGRGGAKV